ncbi:hypothetical protein PCE1_004760 [Barthelona sp. PCE]
MGSISVFHNLVIGYESKDVLRRLKEKPELHLLERRILAAYMRYNEKLDQGEKDPKLCDADIDEFSYFSDEELIYKVSECKGSRMRHLYKGSFALFGFKYNANLYVLSYLKNMITTGQLEFDSKAEDRKISFNDVRKLRRYIIDFTREGVRFISIIFYFIPIRQFAILHNVSCRIGRRPFGAIFDIHKVIDPKTQRQLGISSIGSRLVFLSNVLVFAFEIALLVISENWPLSIVFDFFLAIYLLFWVIMAAKEAVKDRRTLNPCSSFEKFHNSETLKTFEGTEALDILKETITILSLSNGNSGNASAIPSPEIGLKEKPLNFFQLTSESSEEEEIELNEEILTLVEDVTDYMGKDASEKQIRKFSRRLSILSSNYDSNGSSNGNSSRNSQNINSARLSSNRNSGIFSDGSVGSRFSVESHSAAALDFAYMLSSEFQPAPEELFERSIDDDELNFHLSSLNMMDEDGEPIVYD